MPRVLIAVLLLALAGCQHKPLPEGCYVQPVSGKCRASIMRYWYDERATTCKAFIWGGCEGVVPFDTLEACHAQCMAGKPLPEIPPLKGSASSPALSPAASPSAVPPSAPAPAADAPAAPCCGGR